jgi:hypothetical protein
VSCWRWRPSWPGALSCRPTGQILGSAGDGRSMATATALCPGTLALILRIPLPARVARMGQLLSQVAPVPCDRHHGSFIQIKPIHKVC